jgi:hypothetical protein
MSSEINIQNGGKNSFDYGKADERTLRRGPAYLVRW